MQCLKMMMIINIFFVFLEMSTVYGGCHFPQTLYETKHPWMVQSEDGTPNYDIYHQREMTVQGSDMKVEYITSSYPRTSNRTKIYRCEEAMSGDMMYTVSIHEEGKDTFHTCVQFVIRGINVVQWKMAPLTKQSVSSDFLCFTGGSEERLKLMDSPFIYNKRGMWSEKRNSFKPYVACPLDGGYAVMGWHNESGQQMCDSSGFPMMKVENECENGDGLRFMNKKKTCPFPGDKKWLLFCSAHWVHGPWTFMLAIDRFESVVDTVVCMRYPTNSGDSMTLDIFRDSICDSTESFETSLKRYHVDLKKLLAPSLCDDQYPTCEHLQDITLCQDYKVAKSCRKTCSTCREGDVFAEIQGTFPSSIIGKWLKDTNPQGQEIVTIESGSIEIPSLGKYRLLGKADCLGVMSRFASVTGEDYMLLQTKNNGCTARVTTIVIGVQTESVISLRISVPMLAVVDVETASASSINGSSFWWILRDNHEMWCPTDHFQTFRNQLEAFRPSQVNWFNLISTKQDPITISCDVPFYSFTLQTPNGTHCTGQLRQSNPDSFEMNFSQCNGTQMDVSKLEFKCLADYSDRVRRRFIITKSTNVWKTIGVEEYICWAFPTPTYRSMYLYWMHVSECDTSIEDFVTRGLRKELAKIDYEILSVSTGSSILKGLHNVALVVLLKLLFL